MATFQTRFLAVSPEISARLADHPRAFFALRDYAKHIWFLIQRSKWWQLLLSFIFFFVLGFLEYKTSEPFLPAFGPAIMGYLIGPLFEEGAKLLSLRTRAGASVLGAGFAIGFPLVEADMFIWNMHGQGMLTFSYVILRTIGVVLHLYTHFVQAYRLSFFGNNGRSLGSFVSAVVLHGGFNFCASIWMRLAYG